MNNAQGGLPLDGMPAPVSEAPVSVRRVPLPLAGNVRAQWRIVSLLKALSVCRGRSASVEQLHTLTWALSDDENADALEARWKERAGHSRVFRGYTPGLVATLRIAQVEGFVEQAQNGRQKLTASGAAVLVALEGEDAVNLPGAAYLDSLAPISSAEMWRRLGEGPQ